MKCYLAGPMRGIAEFNFPAFDEAAKRGRELGHEIVSPAEMDREWGFNEKGCKGVAEEWTIQGGVRETCVRDVQAVLDCDAIALLPGWETSSGVKFEFAVAKFCGLEILDATTFESIGDVTQVYAKRIPIEDVKQVRARIFPGHGDEL